MANAKDVNITEMFVQGRSSEQLRNRLLIRKEKQGRKKRKGFARVYLYLLLRTGKPKGKHDDRLLNQSSEAFLRQTKLKSYHKYQNIGTKLG